MLRIDLAEAGIAYEDASGRVADFHSLRHTTGAWATIVGASPKAIQTLMRHSTITLTLDTYGHLLPDEAADRLVTPSVRFIAELLPSLYDDDILTTRLGAIPGVPAISSPTTATMLCAAVTSTF